MVGVPQVHFLELLFQFNLMQKPSHFLYCFAVHMRSVVKEGGWKICLKAHFWCAGKCRCRLPHPGAMLFQVSDWQSKVSTIWVQISPLVYRKEKDLPGKQIWTVISLQLQPTSIVLSHCMSTSVPGYLLCLHQFSLKYFVLQGCYILLTEDSGEVPSRGSV